jgi:hypothetical protein
MVGRSAQKGLCKVPPDDLPNLSRDIRSLAAGLIVLRVAATDDLAELAATTVHRLMQTLSKRYMAYEENKNHFIRGRRSIDPIRIGAKSYASAHAAAIHEANNLCDSLWLDIDPDSRDAAPLATLVRAGFESKLVVDNWPVAKACILRRLNAEWGNAFSEVPARMEDEIASIGPKSITAPASSDPQTEGSSVTPVKSESEIPAEYRDGGTQRGAPLTAKVIALPEKYGLAAPYVSKRYKGPKLKLGKEYVYRHAEIAALSDRKSSRESDN